MAAKKAPAKKAGAKKVAAKKTATKRSSSDNKTDDTQEKLTGFRFPAGNKYWQCRAKHGRNGIWAGPDDLLTDCIGYFEWLEQNPLFEDKGFAYQGVVIHDAVAKMRAPTIFGLCTHLGINQSTWVDYRKKPDFSVVCEHIEGMIKDQKFVGAAADLLNAAIIARDLGLRDAVDTAVTGADGGPIKTESTITYSAEEAYLIAIGSKPGK